MIARTRAFSAMRQPPRCTSATVPATATPLLSGAHAPAGDASLSGSCRPNRLLTAPPKLACTTCVRV